MSRTRFAFAALAALALAAAVPASAATPMPLVATVGPGFTITLTKAGKKVTTLKAGAHRITVRDRSDFHNFRLRGPGVNRATGVAQRTSVTWTLRLCAGRYTYVCDPHATSMRGSFTVR